MLKRIVAFPEFGTQRNGPCPACGSHAPESGPVFFGETGEYVAHLAWSCAKCGYSRQTGLYSEADGADETLGCEACNKRFPLDEGHATADGDHLCEECYQLAVVDPAADQG